MTKAHADPRPFLNTLANRERTRDARAQALQSYREAYRLARLDNAQPGNPPGRTGNAAIWESADLMHRRVRHEYLNNPSFRRPTHLLRDLVVGSGIHAYADPIDYSFGWRLQRRPQADLFRSLQYALETDEKFQRWADDPEACDVAGKRSWWDFQRLIFSEIVLVGSVLLVECSRPGREIPICYQLIEREQIRDDIDRPGRQTDDGWKNAIINGIEVDRFGREVAAHVWTEHPHDGNAGFSSAGYKSERIPARRYRHLYLDTRPTQTIGATWLHAIGLPAQDRNMFTESELRTAVKAARLLLVAKLNNPNTGNLGFEGDIEDPFEDPYDRPELALGSDTIAAEVGKDEDVQIVESNRPNNSADKFIDHIDHDIAGGTDLSYYSLTGRFERTNYGGFRGAMNLEAAQMKPIQDWLARRLVLPVRRRWNELAVGLGMFESMDPATFARQRERLQRFDAIGPGRQLLDAESETEGDLSELRGGLDTLKRKCQRRGLHWIKVLRQIAIENQIASVLGVQLDHSKGQGGQSTTSTRDGSQSDESQNAIDQVLDRWPID